jgi:NDP-4-keto-2,6-dideoxyhexose 3-C-methyltransferase
MYETCRSCCSGLLVRVLSLGDQYLSDFRDDDELPPRYPLELVFCRECFLLQLTETTPAGEMYHERYGFKSGVNATIREDLYGITENGRRLRPDAKSWLDIASNDGTLLASVPRTVRRVGIDPIAKYCDEAKQHADTIVNAFFAPELVDGPFDVVTSISMFYDLDDPDAFVAGVKEVLAPDGVWIVQQNYLLTTLQLNAIDNICHEHLTYFGLLSLERLLERHGLEIFRVQTSMINGGSFRTMISRKGVDRVETSVGEQRSREMRFGLDTTAPYAEFATKVERSVGDIRRLVRGLNERGKRVAIYGASTRGGTIWQAAGLDHHDFVYAVERNPEKVGKRIASIQVPIVGEEYARDDMPDYMFVSPWFFRDEFVEREKEYLAAGGHLIFPIPRLMIVGADSPKENGW